MIRKPQVLIVLALFLGSGLWWLLGSDRGLHGSGATVEPEVHAAEEHAVVEGPGLDEVPRREVVRDSGAVGAPTLSPPGGAPRGATGLRGVVKELGGGGISGVELELMDPKGTVLASTVSGSDGRFSFDVPAPPAMVLASQLQSGEGPRLTRTFRSSRPITNVTVWIPPPGVIEGDVVDGDGTPVEGALVASDRPTVLLGMLPWDGPELEISSFVRTDEFGHFVLRFAKQGAHRLRASLEGLEGSVQCEVGDPSVRVQLGRHPHGAVVLEGELRQRGTGQPIPDASVSVQRVRRSPGGYSAVGVSTVSTDPGGRYEVVGLEPGRYVLSTLPSGFAPSEAQEKDYAAGRHTIDFTLDVAREVLVTVVSINGTPIPRAELRVEDASGGVIQVPNQVRILSESIRAGDDGQARLRLLPAAPLTLFAARGDLLPAAALEIDLTAGPIEPVTLVMPTDRTGFARTHFLKLLGPDGEPAQVDGEVLAESFDGDVLLSRVKGAWRDGEFTFGHERRYGFDTPTIAVGASQGACRVELSVPGYRKKTLTIASGAKSPTRVRLTR